MTNGFNRFGYCTDCRNNNDESRCKQCYRGSWYQYNDRDNEYE